MKGIIFWDITPCSPLRGNFLPASWLFLACLDLLPWRWRRYVLPKRRLTLNGLHDAISPEDNTLHNHRCENLKSYNTKFGTAFARTDKVNLLVLAEIISSTLKMEAICSSETSVVTLVTSRHHIPVCIESSLRLSDSVPSTVISDIFFVVW
jgi:hypothetical protein